MFTRKRTGNKVESEKQNSIINTLRTFHFQPPQLSTHPFCQCRSVVNESERVGSRILRASQWRARARAKRERERAKVWLPTGGKKRGAAWCGCSTQRKERWAHAPIVTWVARLRGRLRRSGGSTGRVRGARGARVASGKQRRPHSIRPASGQSTAWFRSAWIYILRIGQAASKCAFARST